jgi:hypothetical protein
MVAVVGIDYGEAIALRHSGSNQVEESMT